jgi:sporulation protein YlmC with PRC-barrel domain
MANSTFTGTGDSSLSGTSTGSTTAGDVRETHSLIASDKVEGTPVRRSDGEKIGTIERVMIDKRSGRVAYAVMSFGGFMGLGEEYYTLPWGVLKYNTSIDGYELNLTEDQLRGAPRRTAEGRDASFDRDWEEHVHRYYNATPYWGI